MAIQTAAAVVSGVALMAIVAGVLVIRGRGLVAGGTVDARVSSGLDVKPERAVSPFPLVLQMAILAVRSGPEKTVRERRRPVLGEMTIHARAAAGGDTEGLEIAVAVPAFQGQMRADQREPRLEMVETGHLPGSMAMTRIAIRAHYSPVNIRVTVHTGQSGLGELSIQVALTAGDEPVEAEQVPILVPICRSEPRHITGMTRGARRFQLLFMGRSMTGAALPFQALEPFAMAGSAFQGRVKPRQGKPGLGVVERFGRPTCGGMAAGAILTEPALVRIPVAIRAGRTGGTIRRGDMAFLTGDLRVLALQGEFCPVMGEDDLFPSGFRMAFRAILGKGSLMGIPMADGAISMGKM